MTLAPTVECPGCGRPFVRGDPEWELCIRCEGPPAGTHWVDDDERAELALVCWDDAVHNGYTATGFAK
jgi:hypothetical protein